LGILAIITILSLLGYGYYDTQIAVRWQPVIRVNDTVFPASYLAKELKLSKALGARTEQIYTLVEPIIKEIQKYELIRQGAKRMGFSLTPEEINNRLRLSILPPDSEVDEAQFQKLYRQRLKELGISEEDYLGKIETQLLLEKLREFLEAQIPQEAEQVHLHVIVVKDEGKAKELKARLEAGEDFATLAKQFSEDETTKAKGGELGWLPRGIRPALDEVAFALDIGEISEPLATTEGFYLLKVTDKGIRGIDEENMKLLKMNALSNWLAQGKEKSRLESYLTPKIWRWLLRQIR